MRKSIIIASLFLGVFFAIGGYFVLVLFEIENPLYMAFLCGVFFAACMMMVFIASEESMNRKFRRFEEQNAFEILFKADGLFDLGRGKIVGRIYFSEDMLILASVEKKEPMVDGIAKGEVSRCEVENVTTLNIFTTDFRKYVISTAEIEKVVEYMEKNDWI